jgi:hypothetical protein
MSRDDLKAAVLVRTEVVYANGGLVHPRPRRPGSRLKTFEPSLWEARCPDCRTLIAWHAKRQAVQQRTTHKLVERLSDAGTRRAEQVMEVEDHALEVIDQALTKFEEDMHRTHMVRHGASCGRRTSSFFSTSFR